MFIGTITLIGVFLTFLLIRDFLKDFETHRKNKESGIQLKIDKNIAKESEINNIEKKIQLCNKRVILYEELGKISSFKIVKCVIYSFIFLLMGILLYLFLPSETFNLKTPLVLAIFYIMLFYILKILFLIEEIYPN